MIYTTLTGPYQAGTALHSCLILAISLLAVTGIILLDMRRRKEPL